MYTFLEVVVNPEMRSNTSNYDHSAVEQRKAHFDDPRRRTRRRRRRSARRSARRRRRRRSARNAKRRRRRIRKYHPMWQEI